MRFVQALPTILIAFIVGSSLGMTASASDCTRTTIGLTPLNEFVAGQKYLDLYEGGLYSNGQNQMPTTHLIHGLIQANEIQPRLTSGVVDAGGRVILMSIGMSNTTQEWCGAASVTQRCGPTSFMTTAQALDSINFGEVTLIDGAKGGQVSSTWDAPTDPNYDRIRDTVLVPQGLSEAQVQAVWVKVANPNPTVKLPQANADAFMLKSQIGSIARALRVRYPNLRLMFLSNRIYAGYASTTLNPEPYAYESGFGAKWVIRAQIEQLEGSPPDTQAGDLSLAVAPHISWGPNLWGDGMTPRADGMIWECSDFNTDGTHPATTGRGKVAQLLVNFFATSPLCAEWYRATPPPPSDIDNDGSINGIDLTMLLAAWSTGSTLEDIDRSGIVDGGDLAQLLADWTK